MVTSLSSMKSLTFNPFAAAKRAASAVLPSIWEPSELKTQTALLGSARQMPLAMGQTWPKRPELNCTPGVRPSSGCPGKFECPWRYFKSCPAGIWPSSTENKYCVATRWPASSKSVRTNFSGQASKKASKRQTSTIMSKAPPVWPPYPEAPPTLVNMTMASLQTSMLERSAARCSALKLSVRQGSTATLSYLLKSIGKASTSSAIFLLGARTSGVKAVEASTSFLLEARGTSGIKAVAHTMLTKGQFQAR
mmetsp:Transcript_82863/g.208760  ORF Transcript_82863/g.208760 Transcript_82863/m.208760 type:complete len:250 (-) Transcript_82863:32-781(-)